MCGNLEDTSQSTTGDAETVAAVELLDALSGHAVFALDAKGGIVTWPASAERLYGHDIEAVLGRELDVLFADRDKSGAADTLLTAASGGATAGEHWHSQADGSVFLASVTVSPLPDREGYAVVARDATAEQQHRKMLERQNDRLKEFTDIIAHDLRAPLQTIEGRLELYHDTGQDAQVTAAQETAERMGRLVEDLLEVARQGRSVTDPERTHLQAIVKTAWEGTGNQSPGSTLRYDPVPPVNADPDRLHQVFENLFRNAVDHGSGDPIPESRAGNGAGNRTESDQPTDRSGAHESVSAPSDCNAAETDVAGSGEDTAGRPDGGVTVRVGPLERGFYVEDDGPGIPENIVDEVFDHGVTTADNGTGYGLSVVRTITNAHGWEVQVTNTTDGGARIEVTGVEFVA